MECYPTRRKGSSVGDVIGRIGRRRATETLSHRAPRDRCSRSARQVSGKHFCDYQRFRFQALGWPRIELPRAVEATVKRKRTANSSAEHLDVGVHLRSGSNFVACFGAMRAPGLSLILLGVIAFAVPAYRHYLPAIPLSDFELHVTAGGMFVAGAVLLLLTRTA